MKLYHGTVHEFVYANRKNRPRSNKYDIIIGPLADNALNKWFEKRDKSEITWEELWN